MLYTTPLSKIYNKHAVTYHMYADDQQLYLSFKPSNAGAKEQCIEQLQGCIADICKWMSANMLKLNDKKNKFIMFGTNSSAKEHAVNLNQYCCWQHQCVSCQPCLQPRILYGQHP